MGRTYKDAKNGSKLASKYNAYQKHKKNKIKNGNKHRSFEDKEDRN